MCHVVLKGCPVQLPVLSMGYCPPLKRWFVTRQLEVHRNVIRQHPLCHGEIAYTWLIRSGHKEIDNVTFLAGRY